MDETLIVVTFISMLGGLIGIELLNHNWFKRENHKASLSFEKKSNDLKLKQLAKELGVSSQKVPPEPPERSTGGNLAAAILPELIKNMDPDTIANIATNLIGGYGGRGEDYPELEGGGGGGMDMITDFIANNPDVVKSFLSGVKGGKTDKDNIPSLV